MAYILKVIGDTQTWKFVVAGKNEYAAQWRADGLDIEDTAFAFEILPEHLCGLVVEGDKYSWEFEMNLFPEQVAKLRGDGLRVDEILKKTPLSFVRGAGLEDLE